MRRSAYLLLCSAALLHGALLAGWRWPERLTPYFFDAAVLDGGRGLDFYAVYQAGYNARRGADIYEGDPAQVQIVVPYFTPYRYLPAAAYTVGAVLSLFAPLAAYKLWVVVIELTLLGCLGLTWWMTRDLGRFAPLASMWLCFTPFYLELFMGQFSLVQGALIFGMLLLADPHPRPLSLTGGGEGAATSLSGEARVWGRGVYVDVLWLVSVLWKINTLIFAPALLRWRRYRILAIAALAVAFTLVPYFLVFPAHWRDFFANNFGQGVAGHELGNLGFRQLVFESLAAFHAPAALQRLAQLVVVVVVLLASFLYTFPLSDWRLEVGDWRLSFAPRFQSPISNLLSVWLAAFFLISPQIWEHHYVMLLPVLVTAYGRRPNWRLFLIWLLLALPTPFGFIGLQPVIAANHDLRAFPLEPAWQPLLQHASKAAPTLWLFIYLLWQDGGGLQIRRERLRDGLRINTRLTVV